MPQYMLHTWYAVYYTYCVLLATSIVSCSLHYMPLLHQSVKWHAWIASIHGKTLSQDAMMPQDAEQAAEPNAAQKLSKP
jgi:hypothetical protein